MLRDLCIRNFALIDELHVSFDKGLNILTGETGTGKTILINAISLLLGGRALSSYIRSGVDCAEIEAAFQIDSHPIILSHLRSAGLPSDAHEDLIVRRIIYRSEKSNRCYINGRLCSLRTLIEIGNWLVDMHGQHEHQLLLHSSNHLHILDKFGGLEKQCHNLSALYHQYKDLVSTLHSLKEEEKKTSQELQLLAFQKNEIDKANIKASEIERLYEERKILANARKIKESSAYIQQTLYQSDGSVSEILSKIQGIIRELSNIDNFFSPLGNQIEEALCHIEDVTHQLLDYEGRLEISPERLDEIEDRINEIKQLQKKYHADTIESLMEYRSEIEYKLSNVESLKQNIEKTEIMVHSAKITLAQESADLSRRRHAVAKQLESLLNKEFLSLNMNQARFSVSFKPLREDMAFGAEGYDHIEYLISTNLGEPLKPLAHIVSGGEISRIMLALKSSLAEADQVLTLTFDEIDTGIGGKVIGLIAKKLSLLSKRQQIICITHSPQIASYADIHYLIQKKIVGKRTLIQAKKLHGHERVDEIAKMMGADLKSEIALQHAREILQKSVL
ncbi:MAG: DNA repair protein RecN [bacterium]